jgi:hypothetical protein
MCPDSKNVVIHISFVVDIHFLTRSLLLDVSYFVVLFDTLFYTHLVIVCVLILFWHIMFHDMCPGFQTVS